MFEIFSVSSWDISHSQFGIQHQILDFLYPVDIGIMKFQTLHVIRWLCERENELFLYLSFDSFFDSILDFHSSFCSHIGNTIQKTFEQEWILTVKPDVLLQALQLLLLTIRQKTLKFSGATLYNSLPRATRQSTSLSSFKIRAYQYFLDTYI
jgi:hypothetical protein